MDKSSKKLVNSALKGLIDRLEKTEKFVLAELPELCQQIVKKEKMEEKFSAITYGATAFLFLVSSIVSGVISYNVFDRGNGGMSGVSFAVSILFALGFLGTTETSLSSIRNLLSLKAAPKLFVLKELKRLVDLV